VNSEQDTPDTLCDHCENQPECDRHYLMCVDFVPKNDPKASNDESDGIQEADL